MTPDQLILTSLALPLLAVGLIFLFGKFPNVRDGCSIIVSVVLFGFTCQLARLVFNGLRPELVIGEMTPGFQISFIIEPLGMIFALVASGLWILTTIYAIGYMRGHDEKNQTRFFACFAAAIFAALSAAYAANLLTLFVAYEVMTISTYPLVTHNGDEEARRGTSQARLILLRVEFCKSHLSKGKSHQSVWQLCWHCLLLVSARRR